MATLTLKIPAAAGAAPEKAAGRGFWRRVFDAMVEARLRRAEAEVHRYKHLLPTDPVKDAGYRVGLKDVGALPFVR